MISHDDTAYLMAAVSPDQQHALGARLIPIVDTHGNVHPESGDGAEIVRVTARRFLRNVGVLASDATIIDIATAIQAPSLLFAQSDFDLVITDSRVVIVGKEVRDDGTRIVGQIRLPWVLAVGFRPKQSIFNDAELVIHVSEPFDRDGFPNRETGRFDHTFTFVFPKHVHPGGLAQTITQRAARYVASMPGVATNPFLIEQQQAAPLPNPPKGEHSFYYSEVFCSVPGGEYGFGDGPHAPDWSGPHLT